MSSLQHVRWFQSSCNVDIAVVVQQSAPALVEEQPTSAPDEPRLLLQEVAPCMFLLIMNLSNSPILTNSAD